jgi:hypothetical protein
LLWILDEEASDMHEYWPFLYWKKRIALVPGCEKQYVDVSGAKPEGLADKGRFNPDQEQVVATFRMYSLYVPAASRLLEPWSLT